MTKLWAFCKHPVGFGLLLISFGLLAFYLPIGLGIARTNEITLDYGDIVSIGAFVATIVIAVFSIIPNLQSMAETSRSAHYSELDTYYLQILSMAVERPYLRRQEESDRLDADQQLQYDTYAFIVWNFLETIHDRCQDSQELRGTWGPIIAAEHAIHRRWFERETVPYAALEAPKFSVQFCDFIWRSFWVEPTGSGRADDLPGSRWARDDWAYRPIEAIRRDPAVSQFLRGSTGAEPLPNVD